MLKQLYSRTMRMEDCNRIHSSCGVVMLSLLVMLLFAASLGKHAAWVYSYAREFLRCGHKFQDLSYYYMIDFVESIVFRMWKLGSRLTVMFWFTYCTVIIKRQVDSFAKDPVMDDHIQNNLWNVSERSSLQFDGTIMAVRRLNSIRLSTNDLRRHSWMLSAILLLELISCICLLLQLHKDPHTFDDLVFVARGTIEALAVVSSAVAVTFSISFMNAAVAALPGQLKRRQTGSVLPYNVMRLEQELHDDELQFHPTGLQLSSGSFSLVVLTILASLVTLFVYYGL